MNLPRLLVLILWLALLALLWQRDILVQRLEMRESEVLSRGRETSFSGVYFQNQRIGYVKSRLTPTDDDLFLLEQEALLRLNILGQIHPINLQVRARLTPASLLRDFHFTMTSPLYQTEARGRVEGREVIFSLDSGKGIIHDRITLAAAPYFATNRRAYLLAGEPEVGRKIRIPYFDPLSLAGQDTVVEYRGLDKVVIHGRVHNLHRFTESFRGIRINSWLDDQGKVIKEESPAGFVFLAEPEFRATDIPAAGPEILGAVAVPLQGKLPADLAARADMRYRLQLPTDGEFDLAGGRQEWNGETLTIRRETLKPQAAPCSDREAELRATPYIQSNDPAITALAEQITAGLPSWPARLAALTAWVYDHLEKRPVLGIPDARSVLESKIGDCNEHAVLLAALARAAGLPTRIAAGVYFTNHAFYYHAWNEVCLDQEWLSVDPTFNQLPADLTHLRFVVGETREMVRIGALLNQLQISLDEE